MDPKAVIRDETDADKAAIAGVTIAAFETLQISDQTEHFVEVFFALSFDGHIPQGNVIFHDGFRADGRPGAAADAMRS